MTNLERAAAIAAEKGWPLVETYRGWMVYGTPDDEDGFSYWVVSPHEMDASQLGMVFDAAFGDHQIPNPGWTGLGLATTSPIGDIDDVEAAREAMPATAFFGVEEEVLL